MKALLLIILVLAGALIAGTASAATMPINATQDAMDDKFDSDHHPYNTYLLWLKGTHFFTQQRFGVRFDELSSAPPPEQVSRVLLQLRLYGGFGNGRARVRVSPSEDDWTAENFPNRGLGVNINAPFVEAVVDAPDNDRWISFNVTNTVKDWLRHPETNHGFSVSAQPADLANPDIDPSQFTETEYALAFESTDSARPESSEQFGHDFPPGHPPRLKIDYQPIANVLPPSKLNAEKPTPTPAKVLKKQVKGITDKPSWFESFTNFFSSFLPEL